MWPGSWEWEREICLAELPQLSRESSAARHLAKRSADALNDYRIRKCGGCLSRRFVFSFPCHRHHRRLSLCDRHPRNSSRPTLADPYTFWPRTILP